MPHDPVTPDTLADQIQLTGSLHPTPRATQLLAQLLLQIAEREQAQQPDQPAAAEKRAREKAPWLSPGNHGAKH